MSTSSRPHLDTLDVALAMAGRLPDYVQAGDVFRPITIEHGDHVHHVTMTLGGLVQRLYGPRARGSDDERLARADVLLDEARELSAYTDQLKRELRSNHNLWRSALEDLMDDQDVTGWATTAGHRTRLELLLHEARALELDTEELEDSLASADARARLLLDDGEFIGPSGDEGVLPRSTFWWLWSRPKSS